MVKSNITTRQKLRLAAAWKAGTATTEELAARFGYASKYGLREAITRLQKTDPQLFPKRRKK